MSAADERPGTATATRPAEETDRTLTVAGGRTVTAVGAGDVVELRSPAGLLELSIRLTEAGPVLLCEAVKVAIKGSEAVSIETKSFEVRAEHVGLHSAGELHVTSEKEMKVTSTDDVRVVGKIIHLN